MRRFAPSPYLAVVLVLAFGSLPARAQSPVTVPTVGSLLDAFTSTAAAKTAADAAAVQADANASAAAAAFDALITPANPFVVDTRGPQPVVYYHDATGKSTTFTAGALTDPTPAPVTAPSTSTASPTPTVTAKPAPTVTALPAPAAKPPVVSSPALAPRTVPGLVPGSVNPLNPR